MKWCVQILFSLFCQALSWLSLLAEKHSRDHHQPDWRSDEAAWGEMERLQSMSLEKSYLMISYHFRKIVTELVASEQNRHIKNPDSEVTRGKRESGGNLILLCLQKKNLCIIWGKFGMDSSIFSVCCPRSSVRNQEQQTPFPRTVLPAEITLAALCAVQHDRTWKPPCQAENQHFKGNLTSMAGLRF